MPGVKSLGCIPGVTCETIGQRQELRYQVRFPLIERRQLRPSRHSTIHDDSQALLLVGSRETQKAFRHLDA